MHYLDRLARLIFSLASTFLMLLAFAIIIFAGFDIYLEIRSEEMDIGSALLDAIGYTIIGVAVFQVANNFFDTEVVSSRDTDVRSSTSKFVSTISVAILLEALVAVFKASQESLALMLYPTLLLFGGIALMVGLGVYLHLTKPTESEPSATRGGNQDTASTARSGSARGSKHQAPEEPSPHPGNRR